MRRARERSEDEFFAILRRCIEGVTVVSIPVTTMLALGADVWIRLALKDEYAPSALSMRALAPTFVFAYGNVLLWLALMILGRSWTITIVSIAGLIALPLFIFVTVPFTRAFGPGGAGMGVGLALSTRELVVILVFLYFIGRRALDRRSVLAIVKTLGICVVVTVVHFACARFGPVRLAIDAAVYLALGLLLRVYRVSDGVMVLNLIRRRGQ
jgi:O-antigen/teichoic acid export membrane protein